ncbi:type III secretion system needle complex protein [Erwinia sp. HDF1-3R]|uniref:type III secretion system needle complex protein n=1 Tax=Erwinia sp. HDF1-3R TaxID=3141543 RepID=UPI0031F4B4A4
MEGWDGFLSAMSGDFDTGVTNLNEELSAALEHLKSDPSNPEYLAKYQSRLSEYTLYRNAQSNVVKVYKDVASAIITNFR